MEKLKCILFNAQSVKNKREELQNLQKLDQYDVICITETWGNKTVSDPMICNIEKYQIFRKDRNSNTKKEGGGVCILVKKEVHCKEIQICKHETCEVLSIELATKPAPVQIFVCYRAHHLNTQENEQFFECISNICNIQVQSLVVGDFNCPNINWVNSTLNTTDTVKVEQQLLLTFSIENSMYQFVKNPTRGPNMLDLVFSNSESIISNCTNSAPFGKSDHQSVTFHMNTKYEWKKPETTQYNFKKADYKSLNVYLASIDWDQAMSQCNDVNEKYCKLCEIVQSGISLYVPISEGKTKYQQSKYMSYLNRNKRKMWKSYQKCKSLENLDKYRTASAALQKAAVKQRDNYEKGIIESGSTNKLFSYVKNQLKVKSGIGPIETENNALCTEDTEKVEIFSRQYCKMFTESDNKSPKFEKKSEKVLQNTKFEAYEICRVLEKLPNKLSTTPDNLPAYFLKRVAVPLAVPLSQIFKESYETGQLPTLWKEAIIVPVFKKGEKSKAENYRPVALTSVICKTMETMIKNHMMSYLFRNKLIAAEQHGFVPGKSTTTQLLECTTEWSVSKEQGHQTDVIYTDYSKAYDKVVQDKLLIKLKSYGITGNTFKWISNFLQGRKQKVKVNQSFSRTEDVKSGIGQGTVLGPHLFQLYVNEIPKLVDGLANCAMFADDLKVWREIKTIEDQKLLQQALDKISMWSDTWQMELAVEKCHTLCIGIPKYETQYKLNGQILKSESSVRDLGIQINSALNMKEHITKITQQATQRGNMILRSFKSRNIETLSRLFKVFVRPLIEYASQVFSPHNECNKVQLEKVQRTFTRRSFWRCFHTADVEYSDRLKATNLQLLEKRRIKMDLILMFKAIKEQANLKYGKFLNIEDNEKRNKHKVQLKPMIYPSSNLIKFNYFYRTQYLWNTLPKTTFDENITLNQFKSIVDKNIDQLFETMNNL